MNADQNEFAARSRALLFEKMPELEEVHFAGDLPSSIQLEADRQHLSVPSVTEKKYPRDACVHELVARQAAMRPDEIALVAGNQVLSYRELNSRANQLAFFLQASGVGRGMLVGLCMERSVEMVVGLLGILKAGSAYVPLDPTYPPERLAFLLEDSQATVLVTQQHLSSLLAMPGVQLICLDAQEAQLAQEEEVNPTSEVTADDLAYVIYTSGSTGQPKGVQITHDSLLNLVFWHQQAFAVTPLDRATQVASPAFDATGWELWPYLTLGASIYLPAEDIRVAPVALRDWLVDQQITMTFLPTALAERVIDLDWPSETSLRFLLTGADQLHTYPAASLPFAVINNYGPTEATVVATSGRVFPTEDRGVLPSIGWPIANTQIYILDDHLCQVPTGEPGELYIGGAGVARGYHNRPELTAQRFISHPFSNDPRARLYKTGDLARYLPDGQLAFLGRADDQVKIRGYRIEPGEIVAAINKHAFVRESFVIAREVVPGEKQLVAYVVPVTGEQLTASSLREVLAISLPDYMLPSRYVQLQALPVTPNGKVDRVALPLPDAANTLRDAALALPSTPMEMQLVEIMAPLLGLQHLSIDDNFFMLGGHSLLGTQIIMRVAATFGVSLTLLTLFEAPTVRQLAVAVEQQILARLETMSDDEVARLLGE